MKDDPWVFGTNQLLTAIGFLITAAIAIATFRTFGRWLREKIEERRIEAAIDSWRSPMKAGSFFAEYG